MYCVDNGTMIATLGRLQLSNTGATPFEKSAIRQDLRTDETPISWD
jgi:tRNA A37 threonylcarbamoyltransferase TsaD